MLELPSAAGNSIIEPRSLMVLLPRSLIFPIDVSIVADEPIYIYIYIYTDLITIPHQSWYTPTN